MNAWLRLRAGCAAGALVACVVLMAVRSGFTANLGTVVQVIGRAVDLVHDSDRGLVYIANITENEVDVYAVGGTSIVGKIPVGLAPASLAMSPDGQKLYVANAGSPFSISVVDLNEQQVVANYSVTTRPDSVAVGNDGLVLILGPGGLTRLDPTSGQFTPLSISVPAAPGGLPNIPGSPVPSGFRAGLLASPSGSTIIGLSQSNAANGRLFVYEVASGTVLRARNVSGLFAILSMAPDGSRFMAGPFLFDTQTLAVLGRAGRPAGTLSGGSAFSADGNTVYATFSTQPPINPLNTNNPQNAGGATLPGGLRPPQPATGGVLQVLRASSLTPLQGLRLSEPINAGTSGGKIVASPDGEYLFGTSTSGLLVVPIGQLSRLPVLAVDRTNVILSVNPCNLNVVTALVRVSNLGGGRLTFTAVPANQSPAVPIIVNQASGLAPSAFQITFNPRSVTTPGTQQVAIVLVSPEAVNIEPAVLVSLNYANVSQRGIITPLNGVGVDVQLDEARGRLYIANYTLDQVEVYSMAEQSFLPPIRVGNRPLSMAMVNPATMVVANSGSESLSVVDLDEMQVVQTIAMGPIPLNATPLFPRSVAASTNAVLFTAVPLPGNPGAAFANSSVWQLNLLTGTAYPRLNLGSGVNNIVQGGSRLLAPANGSSIAIFQNNGTVVLYDPIADTFPVIRTQPGNFSTPFTFRGTMSAASDGSFYLLDDTVFNSVLASKGTLSAPTGPVTGPAAAQLLTFGVSAAGANAVRIQAATPPATPVQSVQMVNLATLQVQQQFPLPEAVMDITPSAAITTTTTSTRLWPPNPVAQEIGVNGQIQLLRSGMAVDSTGDAYLLTVSGLTTVPLRRSEARPPTFSAGSVVNGASFKNPIAPGSLISIFGSNLAETDSARSLPLPTVMGGACVTANAAAIPLLYTSPTQINAQLPPGLAAGRVTLTVHSMGMGQMSPGVPVQVNAGAPGVFSRELNGKKWAQLFHSKDFSLVTPENPARRDEVLVLYATGLGGVTNSPPAGQAAPAQPPSVATQRVSVRIGFSSYDVQFAGLAPGYVGVYQLNIYVPGDRDQGGNDHAPLPVLVTVGSTSSDADDPPLTSVH